MKIVFIIPGSGDSFYCGNCFRDNLQASALRKMGHDVTIMPLYLPLNKEVFQTESPLFFPATSYYFAQKFFRRIKMPKWIEKWLGSDSMLKMASSMSGTTSAKGMENMTLSMIEGDDQAFTREVDKLINWLETYEKPDLIHLSSSLLIGIAKAIKNKLNMPIICSVQDEEVWIDSMKLAFSDKAWKCIAYNLQYVDKIITTSVYYKDFVLKKIPDMDEPQVIYPGLDPEKYNPRKTLLDPVIGFFYRMNKENGLDILAKAFVLLKNKGSIPNLKLKIGGGYTAKDKRFVNKVKKILQPYLDDVEFVTSYNMNDHVSFFQSISVISVPVTFDESVGLYLCEAFAIGVPAVEPASGSNPEIVGEAGILYQPNTPDKLAQALTDLLTDKNRYQHTVNKAIEKAKTMYNDQIMAEQLLKLYKTTLLTN